MASKYSRDELQKLINMIDVDLRSIQKKYIEDAKRIGQFRENFNFFFQGLSDKYDSLPRDMESDRYMQQTFQNLSDMEEHIIHFDKEYEENRGKFNFIHASGAVISSSSSSYWGILGHESENLFDAYNSLYRASASDSYYQEKMSEIDISLGQTYREIDEILYATEQDPERSAAFTTRQSFDHFFDILAPDEEVRKSPFWKLKTSNESKDPMTVFRAEKIAYAVNVRVKDKNKSQSLMNQTETILSVYQSLNAAHKRGELDRSRCKHAIMAMKTFLEEWIDSIF